VTVPFLTESFGRRFVVSCETLTFKLQVESAGGSFTNVC
jgi:hypothetical protein